MAQNVPAITAAEISQGKRSTTTLWTKIKNLTDDFLTRICNLESSVNRIEVFNDDIEGFMSHFPSEGLPNPRVYRVAQSFTMTTAEIMLTDVILTDADGSTVVSSSEGILEFDIKEGVFDSGGALTGKTSIFTAEGRPKILDGVSGAGTLSGTPEFITNGNQITTGTVLFIEITSRKNQQGSFHFHCYGEAGI